MADSFTNVQRKYKNALKKYDDTLEKEIGAMDNEKLSEAQFNKLALARSNAEALVEDLEAELRLAEEKHKVEEKRKQALADEKKKRAHELAIKKQKHNNKLLMKKTDRENEATIRKEAMAHELAMKDKEIELQKLRTEEARLLAGVTESK